MEKGPEWWVKIGDFGISKRVSKNETELKTMIGTPCYLAPEVLHHSTYTNTVDMWSFACVAYEMLALQVPFAKLQDLENFCQGDFFPVARLISRASSTGIEFVKSLLEPRPEYRPSAKDAIEAEWLRVARQETAHSQADLISGLRSNSSISEFQPYTWVSRETTISDNNANPTNIPQEDIDQVKGYSVDMPANLVVPGPSAARAGRSEGASSSPRHDRHQTGSLCVS